MTLLRRAILAFALIAGLSPVMAAVPPPVPALPDSERRTSYSISGTTCICNVNFAIYGDSTDVDAWLEVWIAGTRYLSTDPTFGWAITSPTGPLSTIPRPITDAVLTFTNVQTGIVQIVGAVRPRRTSQFSENRGVAARDLNQAITYIISSLREFWDKLNDVTGRALISQPGNTVGPLPLPASCSNKFLGFDITGLIPQCNTGGPGSGNVTGPGSSTDGDFALFNGATGASIKDAPSTVIQNALQNRVWASPNGSTGGPVFRALVGPDLPAPGASSLGGAQSLTCSSSNWFNTLSTAGALGCSQPNFTDLAGSISAAQIPAGTIVNAAISNSAAIALSKLATQNANTVVCNATGGAAVPTACTQAQLTALVNVATTSLPGTTPALPNDGTKFYNGLGGFTPPTSAGTHILIGTITAAGATTVNDSVACSGANCLTATYKVYELVFIGIIPSTNGAGPQLQVHSGGGYKAAGYLNTGQLASTAVSPANAINIGIAYNGTATDATNNPKNASPGLSGSVRIYNPSASQITNFYAQTTYASASGTTAAAFFGGGFWNTSGVIDGFQFGFNTGTFSGVIEVYGIQG